MTPTPILSSDSPYLIDASGFTGTADQVFTPIDAYEVSSVMRQANLELQPVTISGAGTGVTGGRVPQGGWVLSLEKLTSVEIGSGFATCGAGVLLRDRRLRLLRRGNTTPRTRPNGAHRWAGRLRPTPAVRAAICMVILADMFGLCR